MFLEATLMGVVTGWARRGRLRNLNDIALPGLWLAGLALLLQVVLWVDFYTTRAIFPLTPYLHIFSYLPLLWFVILNRHHRGMLLCGLGLLMNLAVIAANGGFMPVDPDRLSSPYREELLSGEASPVHAPMGEDTRLALLGDILRMPYGKHKVISYGDIVLAAGLLIFIHQGMLAPPRNRKESGQL